MATVVTKSYKGLEVKTVDADWTAPGYLLVSSIDFRPGAASDKVLILNGSDAGSQLFYSISTDGEPRVKPFNPPKRCKPCIDLSESILSAGHKIILELAE